MGRIARGIVKARRLKDEQQDKKLRKLQLSTNKALRKAKRNEKLAEAHERVNKAKEREASTKRRKNEAMGKRNAKTFKDLKKYGRKLMKKLK